MEKVFKKSLWLQDANEQMQQGIITQKELDDALEIWVNDLDSKTESELMAIGELPINPKWME